jgi:predicted nuclease of predicted toxin-antitoxin system
MRVLADENISQPLIAALRNSGHDVTSIRELHRGVDDNRVLQIAVAEDRVLLTHDKRFVSSLLGLRRPTPRGVILLRLKGLSRDAAAALAANVINSRNDWEGHYSVVRPNQTRMQSL